MRRKLLGAFVAGVSPGALGADGAGTGAEAAGGTGAEAGAATAVVAVVRFTG